MKYTYISEVNNVSTVAFILCGVVGEKDDVLDKKVWIDLAY